MKLARLDEQQRYASSETLSHACSVEYVIEKKYRSQAKKVRGNRKMNDNRDDEMEASNRSESISHEQRSALTRRVPR